MPAGFWQRGSLWPWLMLLIVSVAIATGIAWDVWPQGRDVAVLRTRPRVQDASPASPAERLKVRLFFPHKTDATLVEEERDIARRPALAETVRMLLQELAKSGAGAAAAIPPSAGEVRQAFLDTFGILYVDLGKGFETFLADNGGRTDLALSAVIMTLATNVRGVNRVQFLVDGRELGARVGEFNLRRPLQPHRPGEESLPSASQAPHGSP